MRIVLLTSDIPGGSSASCKIIAGGPNSNSFTFNITCSRGARYKEKNTLFEKQKIFKVFKAIFLFAKLISNASCNSYSYQNHLAPIWRIHNTRWIPIFVYDIFLMFTKLNSCRYFSTFTVDHVKFNHGFWVLLKFFSN